MRRHSAYPKASDIPLLANTLYTVGALFWFGGIAMVLLGCFDLYDPTLQVVVPIMAAGVVVMIAGHYVQDAEYEQRWFQAYLTDNPGVDLIVLQDVSRWLREHTDYVLISLHDVAKIIGDTPWSPEHDDPDDQFCLDVRQAYWHFKQRLGGLPSTNRPKMQRR
jgi:hypothetical protein